MVRGLTDIKAVNKVASADEYFLRMVSANYSRNLTHERQRVRVFTLKKKEERMP